MAKVRFIDNRPTYIPVLSSFPNGLKPAKGQVIEVTENEAKALLRKKNGTSPCWEKVSGSTSRRPKEEVKQDEKPELKLAESAEE